MVRTERSGILDCRNEVLAFILGFLPQTTGSNQRNPRITAIESPTFHAVLLPNHRLIAP